MAASLEAFRARVQRGLAEADCERRRQRVMLLIDRVVVTDADVEIRYVLPITPESEHVRFCQLRKDYLSHFHWASRSGRRSALRRGGPASFATALPAPACRPSRCRRRQCVPASAPSHAALPRAPVVGLAAGSARSA